MFDSFFGTFGRFFFMFYNDGSQKIQTLRNVSIFIYTTTTYTIICTGLDMYVHVLVIFVIIDRYKQLYILYKVMYMRSELFCPREQEVTLYHADSNCVIFVSLQEHFFRYLHKCSSVSFFFYSLTTSSSQACFLLRTEIQYLCHGPSST